MSNLHREHFKLDFASGTPPHPRIANDLIAYYDSGSMGLQGINYAGTTFPIGYPSNSNPSGYITNVAGTVLIPSLPTGDPHITGQLWNSAGTLHISAG